MANKEENLYSLIFVPIEYKLIINVQIYLIQIEKVYNNTIFFIQDTFSLNLKRNGTNDL